ncbi:MAG: glycerol-3-phosphate dehydrogenase [Thermoleophilaceae bacterium]|nr:glycerol-3-phosphate dehydrogenase [Thermoleophilaceae bacterium]
MSDCDVAVVGAGVVGAATALALARRGASVALLEAEPEPGLAASGTNSGILHTGFDSKPGELETELILRSAALRDRVLGALGVPVLRCGALLRPLRHDQRDTVAALAAGAARNGVEVRLRDRDGALLVTGESVTDPVRYTLALVAAAERHGARLRTGFRVASISRDGEGLVLDDPAGERMRCRAAVNCAGLHADEVARLAGDDSFEVYPRKGEFLVFEPPAGEPLECILLPVPSERTKGMLVFPTVDGHVVAGPTAIDQDDKNDWSVRAGARDEILRSVTSLWPAIEGAEPIAAYAGLRPAGRGVNYLIGRSAACSALVNVAAIRSTGLTASLGIAEHVCGIVGRLGVELGPERPLAPGPAPASGGPPAPGGEWWRRTAEHRAP